MALGIVAFLSGFFWFAGIAGHVDLCLSLPEKETTTCHSTGTTKICGWEEDGVPKYCEVKK